MLESPKSLTLAKIATLNTAVKKTSQLVETNTNQYSKQGLTFINTKSIRFYETKMIYLLLSLLNCNCSSIGYNLGIIYHLIQSHQLEISTFIDLKTPYKLIKL